MGVTAQGPVLTAFFVALAVSISASEILLVSLVLLVLPWRQLARGQGPRFRGRVRDVWTTTTPLRRHPLTLPFLCWMGVTLLSAAFSGDPAWSLWIARDILRIAAFYTVLAATRDVTHAGRLWRTFLLVLTLMAAYGLAQAVVCRHPGAGAEGWLASLCAHPTRVRGPYSIYMTFGAVLMLGVLLCVAHLTQLGWRPVAWMIPAGVLMLTTLVFTYARNAWLGLAVGAIVLVVLAPRTWPIPLLIGGLFLVMATLGPTSVRERVRSLADLQDVTLRDRVAMWESGWTMVRDHPLLGVGPGEVRTWYQFYRRPEAVRPSTGHLHNSVVQIAAERGMPALVIWIWLWVAFIREAVRVWACLSPEQSHERALVAASLAGVAAFLAAGLFEHIFGNEVVVLIVYGMMALPFTVQRGSGRPGLRAARIEGW